MAGLISLLLTNYRNYGIDKDFNFGFSQITISELVKVLLRGGPGTKYIKPLQVTRKSGAAKTSQSQDELDGTEDDMLAQTVFSGEGFRMDGDHMEFPFSEAGRYAKRTLSEACVDASAMFLEDDDDEPKTNGKFSCKWFFL